MEQGALGNRLQRSMLEPQIRLVTRSVLSHRIHILIQQPVNPYFPYQPRNFRLINHVQKDSKAVTNAREQPKNANTTTPLSSKRDNAANLRANIDYLRDNIARRIGEEEAQRPPLAARVRTSAAEIAYISTLAEVP